MRNPNDNKYFSAQLYSVAFASPSSPSLHSAPPSPLLSCLSVGIVSKAAGAWMRAEPRREARSTRFFCNYTSTGGSLPPTTSTVCTEEQPAGLLVSLLFHSGEAFPLCLLSVRGEEAERVQEINFERGHS